MEIFTDFIGKDLQVWDTYVQKSKDTIKTIEQELLLNDVKTIIEEAVTISVNNSIKKVTEEKNKLIENESAYV